MLSQAKTRILRNNVVTYLYKMLFFSALNYGMKPKNFVVQGNLSTFDVITMVLIYS